MSNKERERVKDKKKSTSIYRGVHRKNIFGRHCYAAQISVNKETIYLGSYDDEKLAAKAYDKYVLRTGIDRPLNFYWKKLA